MKQLLLFILFPLLVFTQTQIGLGINGELPDDQFGNSVSLSSDGSIVAIGTNFNDGNGSNSGHVRIYENLSGVWTQIGSDINGEAAEDYSGWSVSLSSDGSIIAIGAYFNDGIGNKAGHVRIYENLSGVWTQIGSDINGEASEDQSGYNISLSSNGNIVAIGAIYNNGNGIDSGHVRVYENLLGVWTQIGSDIDGEVAGDRFGWSVSLSSDGGIVAISALLNNGGGSTSGHVRIYENISDDWVQIGSDIDGEVGDLISSVSLSSNGGIVAIGAPRNGDNGYRSGQVRVYENLLGVWTQIGSDINGEESEDQSGSSISLSSDGSIVAIGAIYNDGAGSESGHVRIYKNISGVWTQIGSDIDAEVNFSWLGFSISLSSNGSIVAIGAPRINGGNGNNSGQVRVYDLGAVLSSNSFVLSQFNLYPNPVKEQFTIQLSQGLELQKINMYNNLGQFISSTTKNVVSTINLSQGFYFIEVITNQGKATKKIVIK